MVLYIDMKHSVHQSDLLERLKRGDSAAVRGWFAEYHDEIFQFVCYKISDTTDAEEIVQETFINCLKHLPLFKGDASIATWMKSIARHEVADYYRKKYAKKAIQTIPLHEFILGKELQIEDAHEVATKVKKVLRQMRADYRELLLLKYVDNKQVTNIAAELGRTFKSVEADLFRAREDFKVLYAASDAR